MGRHFSQTTLDPKYVVRLGTCVEKMQSLRKQQKTNPFKLGLELGAKFFQIGCEANVWGRVWDTSCNSAALEVTLSKSYIAR